VANFFIRQPEAPLKQYMERKYKNTPDYGSVEQWGKVAPVFAQYGLFLIKRHPLAFARYYLLVNTKNYFLPPLEKLEIYNLGTNEIWPIAAYWFDLHSLKVTCVSKTLQGTLLFIYTVVFAILNLYFVVALSLFIKKSIWKTCAKELNYTILVVVGFLLLNFLFSVFANIIVIRYQVFPMILLLAFMMLLTDQLELAGYAKKGEGDDARYQTSLQPKIS